MYTACLASFRFKFCGCNCRLSAWFHFCLSFFACCSVDRRRVQRQSRGRWIVQLGHLRHWYVFLFPCGLVVFVCADASCWCLRRSGRQLELVQDKKIVQTWRGLHMPPGHHSVLTWQYEPGSCPLCAFCFRCLCSRSNQAGFVARARAVAGGTKVTLTQTGVHADMLEQQESGGWEAYYFKKVRVLCSLLMLRWVDCHFSLRLLIRCLPL